MLKLSSFSVILLVSVYSTSALRNGLFPGNMNQHYSMIKKPTIDVGHMEDLLDGYSSAKNAFVDFLQNFDANQMAAPLPNVTVPCLMQGLVLVSSIRAKHQYALTFLDSLGKPPAGIFDGDLAWDGAYTECLSSVNASLQFTTNYYSLASMEAIASPGIPPALRYGLCAPAKCNSHDVVEILNFAIGSLPPNITVIISAVLSQLTHQNFTGVHESQVHLINYERSLDTSAIVAIVVVSVLVFLALVGSIVDIYMEAYHREIKRIATINEEDEPIHQKPHLILQILSSFSAYTNTLKLFTVKKQAGQIECLHSIRFLSIAWVILGHSLLYSTSYLSDLATVSTWFQRFSFQVILNGFFSVDSFFMISGLLTAYMFMKEMNKRDGQISVGLMIKFYVHRFWRITPPYMLVIMVSGCLTKYLGSGPNFPRDGYEPQCKKYFWYNLFYVNNFIDLEKSCLAVSWYLANDMQFHWFSPILLIPFALEKRNLVFKYIGYAIASVLLVFNVVIVIVLCLHYPGIEKGQVLDPSGIVFFEKIYEKPWCRMGPFIVGILLGFWLHKSMKNPDFKMNNIVNLVGWILSLVTFGTLVYGLYPDNNGQGHPLNKTEHILYQATSRTLWSIALAFLVFSCTMKKGGFISSILTWSVWVPLSRLSFSAYLIHVNFLFYYSTTQKVSIYLQDISFAYMYIGNMFMAFAGAYLVHIFFEVPLIGLEKFIFRK